MEASSPLAAMQPASMMPPWGRKDFYNPHANSHLPGANRFGPGAFNFRDMSMRPPTSDYFVMRPVRGSSPTASLAADLSQNFHIDMSPQLPTPRRSLFTANLFGTMNGRENTTTPPLPSSSPGPMNECMDISPLPHKAPFFAQVDVHSPTPHHTPQLEDYIMPSSPPQDFLEAPRPLERKKSVLLRPTLSRAKGYSTSSMPSKTHPESQLPAFRFGAGSSKLSTSTSMPLDECFMESPPQDRRPQSANSPSAPILSGPRPKQLFSSMSRNSSQNGSPMSGHSRRPSNPFIRPRKQYRRSLSMFENPADMMMQKKDESSFTQSTLQAVMDIDDPHIPVLPHFFQEGQPDSIPRIAKETLLDVLDGKYNEHYERRMVVDCRFEYEYEGGHIDGAINFNDKELLTSQLFESNLPGNTLLILHCEYSAHRAPMMARHVRKQDRAVNVEHYPKLTYPEIYILDGGYSGFFEDHRERCYPQNYVEMGAKEHAFTCEREMGRLKQTRKLSRAQTFAFGQHGQPMDDSPTAPNRKTKDDVMMGTRSPMSGDSRFSTRRMASY